MIEFVVIVVVVGFLILEGFFSGSETAIISANQARLRLSASKGDRRAKLALRLLDKSEELLATTLVGTNVSVVTVTTLATWLIARWIGPGWNESLVVTLTVTPIVLVFAELLPKCIFRAHADSIALSIAGPLRVSQRLLYVLIWVAGGITRGLLWLVRSHGVRVDDEVSRRELKALAQIGEEHGVFAAQTRRMIQSVFDLGGRLVGTAMVPLGRTVSVPLGATVGQVEEVFARTGHSHLPVYEGRGDNIVGIVNLVDIMYGPAGADDGIESAVRREVTRIPRSKSVGALLTEFRYSQVPVAIVVDNEGRALGLLSGQDLLEEIVGSISEDRFVDEAQAR